MGIHELWHHLEYCVHFWVPQYKKDIKKILQNIQGRTTKAVMGLEGKVCEVRLRSLDLLSTEQRI